MNQLQMLKRALIAYVNTQGDKNLFDKNLFDKNNPNIINGFVNSNGLYISASSTSKLVWIEIEPNTTYTVTKLPQNRVCALSKVEPKIYAYMDVRYYVDTDLGGTMGEFTVTTGDNHKYLVVCLLGQSSNTNTYTLQEMIDSLVIKKA